MCAPRRQLAAAMTRPLSWRSAPLKMLWAPFEGPIPAERPLVGLEIRSPLRVYPGWIAEIGLVEVFNKARLVTLNS